ncbi:MAG: hypothetical protein PHW79_10410 [Candidatus Marinimicrobia bacterium]|nr:hypothetical protein [Candidatus Neomarinimicrobiota bacterium]
MRNLIAGMIVLSSVLFAGDLSTRYSNYGEVIVTQIASAPFPHPARMNGYEYDGKIYSAEPHYSDSSVAIFIPKNYRQTDQVDIVVHFHGWYNNIDSVLSTFKLIEQFSASEKNAILIVPQGPREAPDSFGGKLEDPAGFSRFISDVLAFLKQNNKIKTQDLGNIILSGHSGGYHVISYILMRGGLSDKIGEVYLFDALYGQTEKYVYWLTCTDGKLIDIYTTDGGTKEESELLMEDLSGWKIPYIFRNESELTANDLKDNRLIFIYSPNGHNEVQYRNENFLRFLKASRLADISGRK